MFSAWAAVQALHILSISVILAVATEALMGK